MFIFGVIRTTQISSFNALAYEIPGQREVFSINVGQLK
jgi:hypothetical protein